MLVGWWELYRHPGRPRSKSGSEDFVVVCRSASKRFSLGRELLSTNNTPRGVEKMGVASEGERHVTAPEPGDVSKKHETTNLFEKSDKEDEDVEKGRRTKDDIG